MKTLGYLLLACVALAILRAALAALLVALAIGLLWMAATRPREAAGLIVALTAANLVEAHPWALVSLVAFSCLLTAMRRPT